MDINGFPHAIAITTAEINDREGALYALSENSSHLSNVENILADGGYTGKPFANSVKELLGAEVQVAKRNELHSFKVIPKRWIVERSFAWLDKCRRLWKNCERKINTSLQFVNLAFLVLIMKRF